MYVTKIEMEKAATKELLVKQIEQLNQLVSHCIDKEGVGIQLAALLLVYQGTKEVCAQILQLAEDDQEDIQWLDDITANVNTYRVWQQK